MTLANTYDTDVCGFTAAGSRDSVSCVSTPLGPNTILLLTPGSLPLPTQPETG